MLRGRARISYQITRLSTQSLSLTDWTLSGSLFWSFSFFPTPTRYRTPEVRTTIEEWEQSSEQSCFLTEGLPFSCKIYNLANLVGGGAVFL